ncbi:hypothetical protein D9758_002840 [Tetrapyrgos nigripes]|uniref:Uncharacterized protein n=1 Tax=Tetrapyrgos nigripes TaxID=182062 RepID=A0A8H5GQ85_9AGAR|nr:hypothetical protein D9758_002840 [Tetrapyrgos nigripes]
MPQINIGFIGLSKSGWASTALAPPLLRNDKYALKAVSTTSKESAEASAANYSKLSGYEVKPYHGRTDQIANDPDVGLVAVAVNVRLHKETLTPVLEAGKDFFVEWPAGKNTAETIEFAKTAKAKGLRSIVGLQGWQAPAIKKVQEIIASGKIGKVLSSSVISMAPRESLLWGPVTNEKYSYIVDPSAGATMLDIVIGQQLGPITHVLGDFKSVSATSTILYPTSTLVGSDGQPTGETVSNKAPDHVAFSGILRDSGAFVNVIWRGGYKSSPGRQQFIWEIDGEEGSIRVTEDGVAASYIHLHDPKVYLNGELVEFEKSMYGNIGAAWNEFAKGKGKGVYPTIEDAVKLRQLLDAIQLSGETGKRVEL